MTFAAHGRERMQHSSDLGAFPGAQVRDLQTQARVFQNNRCSACQAPLDLPAVHFLCMHSFHQRCLGDNERECVKCAPENRTVMEIKRSLEASAADQARACARGQLGEPDGSVNCGSGFVQSFNCFASLVCLAQAARVQQISTPCES